jgi:hypothetical protein
MIFQFYFNKYVCIFYFIYLPIIETNWKKEQTLWIIPFFISGKLKTCTLNLANLQQIIINKKSNMIIFIIIYNLQTGVLNH